MRSSSLSHRLLQLQRSLNAADIKTSKNVAVLDPLQGEHAAEVNRIVDEFHQRFYSDDRKRLLILGINPGRLGAGSTGLSFTDTKRCESELGITVNGIRTHEPSSEFVYRVVNAAGGPIAFYDLVYIHSVCPLGFIQKNARGNWVNMNYYDTPALQKATEPFILQWLNDLIATGMRTDKVLCLGTGKNAKYLKKINDEHGFFKKIVPLEHPRYVMQYKAKLSEEYVEKYLKALGNF